MKKLISMLTVLALASSGVFAAEKVESTSHGKAKAAPKVTGAKKASGKSASKSTKSSKKPVKRFVKLKKALKVNPLTGASAPVAPVRPAGLPFPAPALAVYTGTMQCELGTRVTVTQDAQNPLMYDVHASNGRRYSMQQVPTSTGVVRLEDKAAGATWMQLGNKSMLMDQKRGERVADQCQNPQQVQRDQELKAHPVNLLQ